jgi:hypothetical protein
MNGRKVTLLRTGSPLLLPGYGQAGGPTAITLHKGAGAKPGIDDLTMTDLGVVITIGKTEILVPLADVKLAVLAPRETPKPQDQAKCK